MLRRGRRPVRPIRPGRPDEGFTLIELVVSVAILGVVMTAICAAMLVAIKSNQETETRLVESRDVQFASTWFADDVQSANEITLGGSALCSIPVGASTVIQFENLDITTASATAPPTAAPYGLTQAQKLKTVYYFQTVTTDGVTAGELRRMTCVGSPATTTDNVVARSLTTTAPVAAKTATTATLPLTERESGLAYSLHGTRRSS